MRTNEQEVPKCPLLARAEAPGGLEAQGSPGLGNLRVCSVSQALANVETLIVAIKSLKLPHKPLRQTASPQTLPLINF